MVWVRLDDAILDNPKVIRVGPIGFALHVAAMTWCGRNSTDGFVPEAKAKQMLSTTWTTGEAKPKQTRSKPCTTSEAEDGKCQIWELAATSNQAGFKGHEVISEAIRLLVSVGLWHEDFDDRGNFGFRLNDFLDYNPSAAQVRGKSEKRATSGRVGGKRSASTRQANAKQTRSKHSSKPEAKTNPEPEPEPEEKSPTPLPTKPRDRLAEQLNGTQPHQRTDVNELHDAYKRVFTLPHRTWHNRNFLEAEDLANAIDAHGLATCLLVVEEAPNDGMVSGRDDDHKAKHESIGYIFGNSAAFDRILKAARKRKSTDVKSVGDQVADLKKLKVAQ